MKLLSDIINDLIDTNINIATPLLKTKVLASRLQIQNLYDWVSTELEGYPDINKVPRYRTFASNVIGDYLIFDKHHKNSPIPTSGLSEDLEEFMTTFKFQQSLPSLESQMKTNKTRQLEYSFPAEVVGYVQNNWRKMGNPYLQVLHVRKIVSIGAVSEIISAVRNKLLDFLLKVDADFGNLTEIDELKGKQQEIIQIMKQTIINNSGDGSIINTGNKAKIEASITIKKGDFEELREVLSNHGLPDSDISELCEIIDLESPIKENGTFGSQVNEWMKKTIGKAVDGSWEIGIGAAGSLLAEAIKAYYGM
jgi:hypothetical protein